MSHYAYYQHHSPSWGTNNYEFAPPPAPNYIPQASWHGGDYYRAHGGHDAEPSFFDSVWSKVKNFTGSGSGSGRSEAKYWHKRVYGGIVSVNQLMPAELGAAAGYEAIRIWEQHKTVYREPLHDDRGMEREALAGIAVAEASKLWQLAGAGRHGGRETSEIAAATAERIFTHQYGHHNDQYRNREYEYEGAGGGYHDSRAGHRRRRSSGAYQHPPTAYSGHSSSAVIPIPIGGGSSHHRGHHEYEYAPNGHHSGSHGNYGHSGSYGGHSGSYGGHSGGYGGHSASYGGHSGSYGHGLGHPGSYPHSGSYGGGGGYGHAGAGHIGGSHGDQVGGYGGHSPYMGSRSGLVPQPAYSSASGGGLHSPYGGSSSLVPMAAGALVPVSQGNHHRARRNSFAGEYVPSTGYSYR